MNSARAPFAKRVLADSFTAIELLHPRREYRTYKSISKMGQNLTSLFEACPSPLFNEPLNLRRLARLEIF